MSNKNELKLVPIVPTRAMIDAAMDSAAEDANYHEMLGRISAAWRAMLSAAPAQEHAQVVGRACGGDSEHNTVNVQVVGMVPQALWTIGTPVSLCGQPAAEQADTWMPSGADYDRSIHCNPDAMAWADFFVATFPGLADKHDLMLGWFANAMMAMHDFLKSEQPDAVKIQVALLKAQAHKPAEFVTGTSNWAAYMTAQIIAGALLGKEGEA